jgi:hypothetical protein
VITDHCQDDLCHQYLKAVPLGVTSADELDWNSEYTRRPSSPRNRRHSEAQDQTVAAQPVD